MHGTEERPDAYALARVPELQFFIGLVQVSPLYSYVDTAGDFARELFK